MNSINWKSLWLLMFLWNLSGTFLMPAEPSQRNATVAKHENGHQSYRQRVNFSKRKEDATTAKNASDLLAAAAGHQTFDLHLPLLAKPRGFNLPKERTELQRPNHKTQAAAQNYFNNYFPELTRLDHDRSYFSLAEDPIIAKFLSQQSRQFQPRQQPFATQDASILGSGDFGILRGGTFYSDEEQPYINAESGDFYYGDASNTQVVSTTEGFIQKYTYPEEQFAQFRDFADLGTPADSAFSQYVVVYAAKNATSSERNSKPKNIFEQLQEIDKEKAREQKKRRKYATSSSITKLKLVQTRQKEKKWAHRQPPKAVDDDPLIALS